MTKIPQLSQQAREAFKTELANPIYNGLSQELATFRAAQALLKKEEAEETILFDRTNAADQIILTLASKSQ